VLQVAIVIISYGSAADLPQCLAGLYRNLEGDKSADYAVKVGLVENSPDIVARGTSQEVARRYAAKGLRWLPAPENLGYGGGANWGWQKLGDADFYVVLNPDMDFPDGWLAKFLAAFERDPQIGVAGCKLLTRDGKIQHAGGLLQADLALAHHFGYGEPDDGRFEASGETEFVTGAALALSRAAYNATGGFDPAYFPGYYEDVDLCYRARYAGFKVWYAGDATAYHYEGGSFGRSLNYYKTLHTNRLRFVLAHFPTRALLHEFVPAERVRLRGTMMPHDRHASVSSYQLAAISFQPGTFGNKLRTDNGTKPGHSSIINHQSSVSNGQMKDYRQETETEANEATELAGRLDQHADEVKKRWLIEEKPFKSRLPFVAAFRTRFNSISTRWYVQPIVAQQIEFNAAVSRAIEDLSKTAAGNLAVGDMEYTVLASRLETLEKRLDNIETLLQKLVDSRQE
jgi:O-antigen biosynthesis protein